MKRDFLTELGISDKDVIDKIMQENGKDIESVKSKYADYDSVKEQLTAANKQIEEFGKLDYDGLKKTAEDYKAKFEAAEKESKEKIERMKFDTALDNALSAAKSKNVKALRALIDTDGLKLKDDKIIGLDEQLKAIKADNGFLFESDDQSPVPRYSGSAGNLGGTVPNASARAIMGLPPEPTK